MLNLPAVWCVMGPTAVGKTDAVLRWADAYPVSLISVDSVTVYRRLDIGSSKPDPDTLRQYPHALINICEPFSVYSAGDFLRDAARSIQHAFEKGKIPVLVGGSMLYFRVLMQGLAPQHAADPLLRARLQAEAAVNGWPYLHQRLAHCWPERAVSIHPNDAHRIQRALECWESQQQAPFTWEWPGGLPYDWQVCQIWPENRAALHTRIAERVQRMWGAGWWEEVRALYTDPLFVAEAPAMRAVGYAQILQHMRTGAGYRPQDSRVLCEKIAAATRQLAKRQMTWMRTWPDVRHSWGMESVSVGVPAPWSKL